jgi:hypothetical protein
MNLPGLMNALGLLATAYVLGFLSALRLLPPVLPWPL